MKRFVFNLIVSLATGLVLALALLWLRTGLSDPPPTQAASGLAEPDELFVGRAVPRLTEGTTAVHTVCPNGPPLCDFAVVQDAVDLADDGDLIKVATGVYTDVYSRPAPIGYPGSRVITQVVYIDKTVTVRGGYETDFADPPDPIAHPTTLDAQGQGRACVIAGQINPTIEGLRITGGDAVGLGGSPTGDAGGGMYIIAATAAISGNWVFNNTAANHGGGIYLQESAASISGNTITGNMVGGFGGGLYLSSSDATVTANVISANLAWRGGGLHLYDSDATLLGNTISTNYGGHDGGGLHLHQSSATLIGNTVSSNTSTLGGGLRLNLSDAVLTNNTVSSNTANDWGGGLYLTQSGPTLVGNMITTNTVSTYGGGLYLSGCDTTLINNVIADNYSIVGDGSGMYAVGSSLRMLHSTLARNHGGGGSGLFLSGSETTVALTNTILVSHSIGISVSVGSTARMEATLWANGTDWGGDGTILTGTVNYWNDPAFVDPATGDYHITPASAAIDAGVDAAITTDVDGEPRPIGHGHDIGADESPVALSATKQATPDLVQPGVQLTYTLGVTNTGFVTLMATIIDILPAQVAPTGVLTWTAPITPGGVWSETIVVTVELGHIGPLTNVLQVTTEEGAADTYAHTTFVDEPISGLVAVNDSPTGLGNATMLTATVTAGSNISFAWTFGDGAFGSGVVVAHTYPAAGTYTATVTASNPVSILTGTTTIAITAPDFYIYLPLILRIRTPEGQGISAGE